MGSAGSAAGSPITVFLRGGLELDGPVGSGFAGVLSTAVGALGLVGGGTKPCIVGLCGTARP